MKYEEHLKQWDKFSKSGSVIDYLAYRQCVSRNSDAVQGLGEVAPSANDHRGNSDKGNTLG